MGLYQVLLLFATVSVSHFAHCKGISSDSEPIHMSPPDAPFSAFRQQNRGTTRFLRTGEEERQISAGNVVGMVASAINNEGQLGLYLSLGLKPETVKKLLKVKNQKAKGSEATPSISTGSTSSISVLRCRIYRLRLWTTS